ncbi:MAG: hypothetical protein CEN90_71 [Parcubacteria group bacterium Licking1014_17]|nr:MAG: hypothetical protein CEN90_71 [Parcubacteria group bacterium Licking1014_17]
MEEQFEQKKSDASEDVNSLFEKETVEQLEKTKEAILNDPNYQKYKKGKIDIPTLKSLSKDYEDLISDNSNLDKEKIIRFRSTLGSLINDIIKNAESYADILISIEEFKNTATYFHLDDWGKAEWLGNKEKTRKNTHNSLLSSLAGLTRFCRIVLPKELNIHFSDNKFFTRSELENRDYIGSWAFYLVRGHILEQKLEEIEKELNKRKG